MSKKIKPGIVITALIIVVIVVVAGLGVRTVILRNRPSAEGQAGGGGQRGRIATTVRVTEVVRSVIENNVMINGDVEPVNQVSIFPNVGGRITETLFQIGDSVDRGTIVAMIDPSRPGQVFSDSPVLSTIAGTILQAPVNRGDTVTILTPIYVVGDLSTLMIETFVPERFSNAARRGLGAQVFLEALPGETFRAVVDEVSPVLDPLSRTVRIRLRFQGRMDPRIKAGMFATVSLVTSTRQNVPIIPRGTAINTQGGWIVFSVDETNIARRREIYLGLESDQFVEVVYGLDIGDLIVSQGQNFLSDGDPVRILE